MKEERAMEERSSDNTYVLDPESVAEMTRLIQLDQFTTRAMDGPLTEHPDPSQLKHILDLGCGPGGWTLDVAFDYPQIEVTGIDISQTMIRYAIARAQSQGIHNASFGIMDITQPLDFADASFDLVNGRFLVGVLLQTAWPVLLQECMRITRPGGIIRLTECDTAGWTNSPAFERLSDLFCQTITRSGYGFSPDGRTLGMTPMLEHLLRNAGCQNTQSRGYAINFSAGTKAWADFYRNSEILFHAIQPLFIARGITTQEEINQLYAQMLLEMNTDTFCGVWFLLSSWGIRP